MKLLFKQRIFSWFDSYDIYDEQRNTIYTVKGELAWGHLLKIYDRNGAHIATIKERVLTFLPKFQMYIGDNYVGEIKKELTFFRPKFELDCNGWQVEGDILEWNYRVTDRGRLVMQAEKQIFKLSDTYNIDIREEKDQLYSLMIVLAIDAAKCSDNN